MNTIKDSLLIREHWPETEIYVFYLDIRAFGKDSKISSKDHDVKESRSFVEFRVK